MSIKLSDCPNELRRRIQTQIAREDSSKIPHAQHQPQDAPALGGTIQGAGKMLGRTIVRITGFRVRPLDPDNFAGGTKDLLDGLRHAALIQGDEPWKIKLETEQVKVKHFKEQRTEVEIYQ